MNPENKNGPHRIKEGVPVEIQLSLWPKLILHHWNKRTPANPLAYLGFDPKKPVPDRAMLSLREGSNLYLVSGIARQMVKRAWKTDSRKQRINILLDCGLPVVLSEEIGKNDRSNYVEAEGDFLVAICLLFGSIAFSSAMFRTPIIGKVRRVIPMRVLPPCTLLEVEPQPGQVIPETRVSYHSEQIEVSEPRFPDKGFASNSSESSDSTKIIL